jgi:hypothetical protein
LPSSRHDSDCIAAAQPAAFPDTLDTTKLPRLPVASEDILVKGDGAWGLIVGPGDALALNIY